MELEYTYWKSKDGWFIGHLNIWPEHLTQGRDVPELEEMLADLFEFYKEEQKPPVPHSEAFYCKRRVLQPLRGAL
jgi:predicted RNase H-like HicB family nuclease